MYTAHVRLFRACPMLDNRTPYEVLIGDTPDNSELLDFVFRIYLVLQSWSLSKYERAAWAMVRPGI
jgi:hypothetical protein